MIDKLLFEIERSCELKWNGHCERQKSTLRNDRIFSKFQLIDRGTIPGIMTCVSISAQLPSKLSTGIVGKIKTPLPEQ